MSDTRMLPTIYLVSQIINRQSEIENSGTNLAPASHPNYNDAYPCPPHPPTEKSATSNSPPPHTNIFPQLLRTLFVSPLLNIDSFSHPSTGSDEYESSGSGIDPLRVFATSAVIAICFADVILSCSKLPDRVTLWYIRRSTQRAQATIPSRYLRRISDWKSECADVDY